jgi:type I restriction enzyme S subunit
MSSDWKDCQLGDVLTLQRGFDLPTRKRQDGDIPVVSSSGISGYHNEAKVKAPGVVTGRYGTLGEVFYISKDFWPLNTTLYVRDFKGNDQKFISYFLQTLNLAHQNAAGAGPGLNRNALHLLPVKCPPLSIQRKIAAILSAYDDLIENNMRRIEILEEMARSLYREWFVNFHFPEHEQVKMVDSDLGLIPEGWEVKPLSEVCERINYGYTAKAKADPIDFKFLRITDIVPHLIDWQSVPYCEISDKDIQKFRLEEGDIVIARTGATVGYAKRLNKRHPDSVFASYLVRLRINEQSNSHYIGLIVESDTYKDFIKANMSGAAQPQANAKVLTSFPVVLPPKELQDCFKDIVSNFLDQREILQEKNAKLRQVRDLLLPKLISGEIDLENIDINTKEIAG